MNVMQKVMLQLGDEYQRLDEFLSKLDTQHASETAKTKAALKTDCLVVLTENHGHFVMDYHDIIRLLRVTHENLQRELKDRTVLGEDISKLRPS
jgi:energy-coupling factor transporter ATP-binding protein EcfA2